MYIERLSLSFSLSRSFRLSPDGSRNCCGCHYGSPYLKYELSFYIRSGRLECRVVFEGKLIYSLDKRERSLEPGGLSCFLFFFLFLFFSSNRLIG